MPHHYDFKTFFDNAPDGVFICDENGRYELVNDAACKITGYSKEELENMTIADITPEDAKEKMFARFLKLKNKGEVVAEIPFIRKNGEIRYWVVKGVKISETQFMGFTRDITEEKEAKDALFQSEANFSSLLENPVDSIVYQLIVGDTPFGNKVNFVSPSIKTVLGISEEDQHDINKWFMRIHPEDLPRVMESNAKGFQPPYIFRESFRYIHPEKGERWLDVHARAVPDENGVAKYANGLITDITDRKKAEEENQKLLEELLRTEKLESLGILAGGIAHDFNNLLSGIFGYIEMSRNNCDDPEKVRNYLSKAETVFNRAKDLTQQLLTFSKGGIPDRKVADLAKTLQENTSFTLSGKNISYSINIDKDLWLCDFDINQIGQVINNLLLNAIHALPDGGQVLVSAENIYLDDGDIPEIRDGKYIMIRVSDNGTGIDESIQEKIFDPFFSTKSTGTGLGLSMCYSIIRKHDGHICCESEIGKGTSFTIYLPASYNEIKKENESLEIDHKGEGKILLVDDEDYILEIFSNMSLSLGYTPITATDGSEALEYCLNNSDDIRNIKTAILDLTIPGGMGGKETVIHLKKLLPETPIIATSGYSDDPVIAKPLEYGFSGSLRKPFKIQELAHLLNKFLNKE